MTTCTRVWAEIGFSVKVRGVINTRIETRTDRAGGSVLNRMEKFSLK